MRRAWKMATLAVILLAVFAGAQTGWTAQTGRKVTGTVVSAATQRPIANALVQYEEQGAEQDAVQTTIAVQTTQTDAKGQFEFASGRLGVVTVTVEGLGTARRRWPPSSLGALQIALTPPVILQGTLVDSQTVQPLVGAVTALVMHPLNIVSTTALVEDGTFHFSDLPEGPVLILAHAHDHAPSITQLTTRKGEWRDVHVRLPADAGVQGQVLDSHAGPVAGAVLIVTYAPSVAGAAMLAGVVGGNVVTDSAGAFALNGVVPSTPATIYAMKGDRETNRVKITINEGMVHDGIVLRLE